MALEVFHCEQGTEDWHECRRGIPTASEFATVLARGRDGGASLTRKSYLYRLAGEIVTGRCAETYSNRDMERGKEQEPIARDIYAMEHEAEPELVGFIRNGPKGCSPDSLIGADGMLEIKSAAPHVLIEKLLREDAPPEHKAQCQGALWVAEREWIDLAIYCPGLPLVVHRLTRDEPYIANLAAEVDRFNAELAEIVERVRRYGAREALAA
jgi:hypothetical protein